MPIAGLNKEYGVSEPTLYKYIKALGIKRIGRGKLKYIRIEDRDKITSLVATLRKQQHPSLKEAVQAMRALGIYIPKSPEELESEDDFDESLATRGALAESQTLSQSRTGESPWAWLMEGFKREMPTFSQFGQSVLAPLVGAVQQLGNRVATLSPASSLARNLMEHYEFLEAAAERNWFIKTSKLAAILELSSHTLSSKKVLERDGFRFSKAGKSGRESVWKVERALLDSSPME